MNAYATRLPLAIALASALALTAGCNNRTADDRAGTSMAGDGTAAQTAQTTPGADLDQNDASMTQGDATYGDANRPLADGERIGDGRASDQPVNDTWITTKVKSSLLAENDVAGLDINVDTLNGVVTLSGQVEQQAQIDHATRIARAIEGVTDVQTAGLTVGTGVNR